jgi:hypothetical protein
MSQLEVDGLGVGELGAHGLGGEIEFLVEDDVVDIIVQAVSNRWFDKPLQFIVNDNGTAGFMGEHSMMDGTPTPSKQTTKPADSISCKASSLAGSRETRVLRAAVQCWHGDGSNRWFDKPLQFIVNDNGTAGFMGEHSMISRPQSQQTQSPARPAHWQGQEKRGSCEQQSSDRGPLVR